jgi:hypothetical protein
MSFILFAPDCPNTSLQAPIKEGLTISSPNGIQFFLHLAICNDIKYDAVRSEVSVVKAWEIIAFSILCASFYA